MRVERVNAVAGRDGVDMYSATYKTYTRWCQCEVKFNVMERVKTSVLVAN